MIAEALVSGKGLYLRSSHAPEVSVTVTVFIRYQLDPFKRAMFEKYSQNWLTIMRRRSHRLLDAA